MSDKESAEDMELTSQEEVEDDQNKNKAQKRKKPAVKATPPKKKAKVEKKEEPKKEEEKKETATETEEESEDEELPKGLLERSPEVTGTRVRKQVERLTLTATNLESPARKHEIAQGKGVKLGQSPKIVAQLQSVKHNDLHLVHRLLFKRPGSAHEIKKNIKEFSGFPFAKDEKEFESRKNLLDKNTMADLKLICGIFCLERGGTKEAVVERILEFCLCPNPSTKAVAAKKKATNKSKDGKKKTPSKTKGSTSPMKSPTSKELIEDDDSSSSEDENEGDSSAKEEHPASADEDEKEVAKTPAKAKKGETTPKGKKSVATPKAKETKSKETKTKKPAAKKSPKKAEIKVKLPAVNKAKKKLSKDSETEDDKDKADTSKEEHSDAESDASDPPAKKDTPKKKATPAKKSDEPTNDELVDTIKQILKDANLEDMTMKNLCKLVYEKYPECDLEKTRKDFIRSTAKEILGSGV